MSKVVRGVIAAVVRRVREIHLVVLREGILPSVLWTKMDVGKL